MFGVIFGCEHLSDIQSILFPDGFTMFALVSVWFLDSALVILGFYIGIYVFYIWSNVSCIRDSAQFCQDMKFVQKDVMIVAAFS